jgi:tRNA threonylcarbamoyl adenosine modification protein YeaZ
MYLAIETATEYASVAVGSGGTVAAERSVAGSRRQAAELVPTIEEVLRTVDASLETLDGLVVADGPGSFTGLRVGASVAKALAHTRQLSLWTAPSLMVMAAGATEATGELIWSITDALRGDVYLGGFRVWPGRIETVLSPQVVPVLDLETLDPRPNRIVTLVTGSLLERLPRWPGIALKEGVEVAPRAGVLLQLVGRDGGARRIAEPELWEPEYGRPAEAQARWEAEHGRKLPDPARASG